jgi:aminoglycoside/choline kinase family phosphotransferase
VEERTLADAERDYDRALSEGAAAVQRMDEKLRDAKRMLAAVVMAAGGRVSVPRSVLAAAYDVDFTITEDLSNNGLVIETKSQSRG